MKKDILMLLDLAFECGKWEGQVELEEFYERESYSSAFIESAHARKHCIPKFPASLHKETIIILRSENWRKGVRDSVKKRLDMLESLLDCIVENK